MKKRKYFPNTRALIIYIGAVAIFLAWSLVPIIWSFIISITPQSDAMISPIPLFPENPTLDNYKALILGARGANVLLREGALYKYGLFNSFIASTAAIALGLPISIFGAYAFSRMVFKGREFLRILLLATLVIPVFATIVPLFQMFSRLNLIDNFAGLTLVYVSSFLPFTVWLISSFFESIPKEMEEAAIIDGCTPFSALIKVILPTSFPVIFAASLIVFIATWNQFLIPLILAPSLKTKPIAVVVSEFVTKHSVNFGLMNAGGILAIIPPAIVAVVFRNFLIYGLTSGATKG